MPKLINTHVYTFTQTCIFTCARKREKISVVSWEAELLRTKNSCRVREGSRVSLGVERDFS